jgi:hypothetical protein
VIKFHSSAKLNKDAVIVFLSKEQAKNKLFARFDKKLNEHISLLLKSGRFTGEREETLPLVSAKLTVLLVGIGAEDKASFSLLRMVAASAFRSSFLSKAK